MERHLPEPSLARVLLGFGLAPLATAVSTGLMAGAVARNYEWGEAFFIMAALYAYPVGLILGLPVLLTLKDRVRPRLWLIVLLSAGVAAFPWLIATLFLGDGNPEPWLGLLAISLPLGAIGGMFFWLFAVARSPVQALIEWRSARRLARLGGSAPDLETPARRPPAGG